MNIVIAMDNLKLKNELEIVYSEEMYNHDINYMEGVIEYLSKTKTTLKRVLITKDSLQGNLIKEMYIKQIKLADSNVKVILFVKELTDKYKEFLFANEIFSIIEGDVINIEKLIECIDEDSKVIYKYIDDAKKNSNEYLMKVKNQVITKQFISIFGTSGSGKSYVSSILSEKISEDLKINVALLDMDLQNPAIDILNNLDFSNNSLSELVDNIDKNIKIESEITSIMKRRNKNISYMTNNSAIYEYQNKLNKSYYERIYDCCKNNYDYILVDLPSSPFIDVVKYTLSISTKIFFVVNPNYISIRQAVKYLDLITKLWSISKEKICIIINKIQKGSLDNLQIKSLLGNYTLITNIYFNYSLEEYINGARSSMIYNLDLDKLYKEIDVKVDNSNKTIARNILFSKIINRCGKVGVK
ncbi:MAG: hypothetical protein N2749_06155 [Clostridia bacterium]|nr:hypothetical protein [Clostridia bacterium]